MAKIIPLSLNKIFQRSIIVSPANKQLDIYKLTSKLITELNDVVHVNSSYYQRKNLFNTAHDYIQLNQQIICDLQSQVIYLTNKINDIQPNLQKIASELENITKIYNEK